MGPVSPAGAEEYCPLGAEGPLLQLGRWAAAVITKMAQANKQTKNFHLILSYQVEGEFAKMPHSNFGVILTNFPRFVKPEFAKGHTKVFIPRRMELSEARGHRKDQQLVVAS